MKKLSTLCMALCLAISCLAGDKMKLDLPVITDPESMVYFNGSGSAQINYGGEKLTVLLDVDFEHPEDGCYGTLKFLDMASDTIASYAMTRVEHNRTPDSKRVTLRGIDGTTGTSTVSVIFDSKNKKPYRITPVSNALPYFRQTASIYFDSRLRIAPREKTPEELMRDSLANEASKTLEVMRRQELKEKYFRRDAYYAIGILIAVVSVLFAVWMFPRALRRQQLPHLILFTLMTLLSTFPPFFLLPVLPAYFWWYYNLYDTKRNNRELAETLKKIAIGSGIAATLLLYALFGEIAFFYALIWFGAGYLAFMLIYRPHSERARCYHCNYYGPNEIVDRKFLHEKIRRTLTSRYDYDHTEETDEKIIEWYKQKYNLRIESDQMFEYFRQCGNCEEIFVTMHIKTKVLVDRDL